MSFEGINPNNFNGRCCKLKIKMTLSGQELKNITGNQPGEHRQQWLECLLKLFHPHLHHGLLPTVLGVVSYLLFLKPPPGVARGHRGDHPKAGRSLSSRFPAPQGMGRVAADELQQTRSRSRASSSTSRWGRAASKRWWWITTT